MYCRVTKRIQVVAAAKETNESVLDTPPKQTSPSEAPSAATSKSDKGCFPYSMTAVEVGVFQSRLPYSPTGTTNQCACSFMTTWLRPTKSKSDSASSNVYQRCGTKVQHPHIKEPYPPQA